MCAIHHIELWLAQLAIISPNIRWMQVVLSLFLALKMCSQNSPRLWLLTCGWLDVRLNLLQSLVRSNSEQPLVIFIHCYSQNCKSGSLNLRASALEKTQFHQWNPSIRQVLFLSGNFIKRWRVKLFFDFQSFRRQLKTDATPNHNLCDSEANFGAGDRLMLSAYQSHRLMLLVGVCDCGAFQHTLNTIRRRGMWFSMLSRFYLTTF